MSETKVEIWEALQQARVHLHVRELGFLRSLGWIPQDEQALFAGEDTAWRPPGITQAYEHDDAVEAAEEAFVNEQNAKGWKK